MQEPFEAKVETLIPIIINRRLRSSLQSQIYNQIRSMIVDGIVGPGSYLPSSRSVADQYGVSRNTVVQAYEWLLSEGYVESVRGRGTRVCPELPERSLIGKMRLAELKERRK